MKAWKLEKNGHVLEIYDIDEMTKEVKKTIPLRLKKAMTREEAAAYLAKNFPTLSSPQKG